MGKCSVSLLIAVLVVNCLWIFISFLHVMSSPTDDHLTAAANLYHHLNLDVVLHSNDGGSTSSTNTSYVNPSYQLAYEQSFGFFHDIPNEEWIILQQIHAKIFPNHYEKTLQRYSNGPNDKGNIAKISKSHMWNAQNFHEEFHCRHMQRIESSNAPDGPKWICDPHRIARKKDSSCLIYSVGSNGKPEFEKGIKEQVSANCEIHTFDVINSNRRNGQFAEKLQEYATFHHWGLGTQEQADFYARTGRGRPFKTLQQTMQELGHANRTIDVFKIDCEWCEWFTYQEWLKQDLRQILVETHNAPMPHARDFFYQLHDAGYVIFSKEANLQNGGGGEEFAFLKLSTDFFVNQTMYKYLGRTSEN